LNPGLQTVTQALLTHVGAWAFVTCGQAAHWMVQALFVHLAAPLAVPGRCMQLASHWLASESLAQALVPHGW
jgi:hypothetical protein